MKKISHLKIFFSGSVVSLAGVGIIGVINYLISRELALGLSEHAFGFLSSVLAFVMFLKAILDLGFGQSVTILLAKDFSEKNFTAAKKNFTIYCLSSLLLALLAFLCLELAAGYLAEHYFKYTGPLHVLRLLFCLMLTYALESCPLNLLIADKQYTMRNVLLIIKTAAILLVVWLSIGRYGILSVAWAYILAACALLLTGIWYIRKNIPIGFAAPSEIRKKDVRKIFSYTGWIAISCVGLEIMYYIDTVCLTYFKDPGEVGIYKIALSLMQIAQSMLIFPIVFTPIVSEMYVKKDFRGIRKMVLLAHSLVLLLLPVFFIAGYYYGEEIVTLMYDAKYAAAAPALTILWCGIVFYAISALNIRGLNAVMSQKSAGFIIVGAVLLNLILNLALIPPFGTVGAALATAMSNVVIAVATSVVLLVKLHKKIGSA